MQLSEAVLAAFYNDARLNILACLNDIREKQGLSAVMGDEQISSAFYDLSQILLEGTPEEASALIDRLRYRFPFIDTRTDARKNQKYFTPTPKNYQQIFSWMFKLINNLRNIMVHPDEPALLLDYELHKNLFFTLGTVYDDARRMLKTRFDWTTDDLNPLLRCDNKGKPRLKKFSFALCSDPETRANSPLLGHKKVFYSFGHVLLCSLFLEKSQSADLMAYFWQSGHGRFWPDNQHREMVKELVSIYHIKLPLQRLKANSQTTLTIDALSELSRCPRPLLGALSREDKNKFREVIDDKLNEQSDDQNSDQNNTQDTSSQYLLARSIENRFIPLMMRFLDHDPANKLRFAIDLGQFYYHVRLKSGEHFTDNKPRVRRLGQKLISYGKLDSIQKSNFWQQLEANFEASSKETKQAIQRATDSPLQLKPYLVKTLPHSILMIAK